MDMKLLAQYRSIRQELVELNERINQIYSSALFPRGVQITGMPRATGYSGDGIYRTFEKLDELAEFYKQKQHELNELCIQIEKEIEALPSLERRIVRLRYLDGKGWKEISKITGYSVSHLHKINNKI